MSIISGVLGAPFGQAKLIVIALALGGIIASGVGLYFYVGHLKSQVATLEVSNKTLEENNKILQVNVDTLKSNQIKLSDANETNLGTIKSLTDERADAQKVIDTLSLAAQSNSANAKKLKQKIADLMKDPKTNDAVVAPVLRETVRDIQNNRRPQ
jgi:chromosome segregation ATPase